MAKEGKYTTIHYHNYLELDKIINAQTLRSAELETPAHEEMLFIIVHQAYELWFKQVVHEISSVVDMFKNNFVDEKNLGIAVGRLDRVSEILKLLIQQINVLETMTPLDFLDFRNYLFPASGFQSFQFRKIEVLLGLRQKGRMTYNGKPYTSVFTDEQAQTLFKIEEDGSLFDMIEEWLSRTPFLDHENFNFLNAYKEAVKRMLDKEQDAIQKTPYLNDQEKEMRMKMLGGTDSYFERVFDEEKHKELNEEGEIRLSYKATLAALLIRLYKEQPILHMPSMLLKGMVDIDELLTMWRYRHAQMVMRMIGNKMGTGGSSGHDYLAKTADAHKIFKDFHNISSLMIPRSELPELPEEIKKELGFYFNNNTSD